MFTRILLNLYEFRNLIEANQNQAKPHLCHKQIKLLVNPQIYYKAKKLVHRHNSRQEVYTFHSCNEIYSRVKKYKIPELLNRTIPKIAPNQNFKLSPT